jgi:hypothetical protein
MSDKSLTKPEISPEEAEIAEVKKQFYNTPKFTRWHELYTDKGNIFKLDTFKNRQLSAIYAYELNPNDAKDRQYASEIGHKNARKYKNWASDYLDTIGMTPEKIMDITAAKAVSTNNAKYLQILLEITGIYTPGATTLVQNNTQNNITVNEAEQVNFDKAFKDFVNKT